MILQMVGIFAPFLILGCYLIKIVREMFRPDVWGAGEEEEKP